MAIFGLLDFFLFLWRMWWGLLLIFHWISKLILIQYHFHNINPTNQWARKVLFFFLFLSQFLSSENLNLHCRCLLPFGKGLFLDISFFFFLRVLRMGEYDQDIFLGMFCCWFIERLLIFLSWSCHFATIVDQSYKLYDAIFGSFMSNNISSANKIVWLPFIIAF